MEINLLTLIISAIGIVAWLAYLPYAILTLYSLKNIPSYEKNVAKSKISSDKFIIFRFVTRGKANRIINEGISSVINSCKAWHFSRFRVEVIVDDPKDKFDSRATTILVPKRYETKHRTRYKARALNYAIENTRVSKDTWILHLDDESKVTAQTIYAILSYLNDNPKVAAEGAINYPYKFGKNYITSLLESERSLSCLFCISQVEFDPLWLHGSNLLVRSDVEKSIGWDFGSVSIAEDARFGYEIVRKMGSNSIGWHGGTLLEQPTFTIGDTIKQRQRWFIGSIRNFRHMHTSYHKLMQSYFLATWTLGFVASVLGVFGLLGFLYVPIVLKPVLLFCAVIWAMTYQIGLYLNIRHLGIPRSEKVIYHIAAIVLLPLLGIVSTFPTVFSFFKRPTTFEVVQKDIYSKPQKHSPPLTFFGTKVS